MFYISNCVWILRLFHSTRLFHSRYSGFTTDLWIRDGFHDSRWISGFTMDSKIHDGFLDLRWIPGFTMDLWIRDGFLDSRWIFGNPTLMTTLLQFFCSKKNGPTFLEAPHVWLRCAGAFCPTEKWPLESWCESQMDLDLDISSLWSHGISNQYEGGGSCKGFKLLKQYTWRRVGWDWFDPHMVMQRSSHLKASQWASFPLYLMFLWDIQD